MENSLYYIRTKDKVYYTFYEQDSTEEINCWEVDAIPILPYLTRWPELLEPQTIHQEDIMKKEIYDKIRKPTAPPTKVEQDKKKYTRKEKHKKSWKNKFQDFSFN